MIPGRHPGGTLDRRTFLGLAAATLSCTRARPAAAAPPTPKPRLGINLAGPSDYGTELPFLDVFRFSREWLGQAEGARYGEGPKPILDDQGWPKALAPGGWVETGVMTGLEGHMPVGTYNLFHDGEGRLEFWGANLKVLSTKPGHLQLGVDKTTNNIFIRIRESNPRNPLRNIRMLRPGVETPSALKNPWDPGFLARWRGMACVRMMDLQMTNDSTLARWADRPHVEDSNFTTKGVPVELLVDMVNRVEAEPWFCIPHLADDDFVRRFAMLVHERLVPGRAVWLEYSNEVWNGMFGQHRHAFQQGRKLGLSSNDSEAAFAYTAQRSLQIFDIWRQVFGGARKLVRVLPSHAANTYATERILAFHDAGRQADALAIAPYLSFMVGTEKNEDQPDAHTVTQWSVDQLFDHLEKTSLPACQQWMRDGKALADANGLRLVAYEAGQHLVGIGGAQNDETLTRLFLAANAHPRMGALYKRYLAAWVASGGDLLCHFSSVSAWSKYGSWGLLQFADEDPRRSPKFMATMEWARSLGQRVNLPR